MMVESDRRGRHHKNIAVGIHKSFIFLLPFLHLFGYDPFIFIEKIAKLMVDHTVCKCFIVEIVERKMCESVYENMKLK